MDVALLSGNTLRVKGKNATLVINPSKETSKTEADSIINLNKASDFSESKIVDSRITISGPGEYEVGGIKVNTSGSDGDLIARLDVDRVRVLVGSGQAIEKAHEKLDSADIIVVDTDQEFKQSTLTKLDSKVILGTGKGVSDLGKALGKSEFEKVSKYSTTSIKLPLELQYIHLD